MRKSTRHRLLATVWLCTVLSLEALAVLYFVSNVPLNALEIRYQEF